MVGGFKHFLLFHILGKIIPTDKYFSEGWLNHQPDIVFAFQTLHVSLQNLTSLGHHFPQAVAPRLCARPAGALGMPIGFGAVGAEILMNEVWKVWMFRCINNFPWLDDNGYKQAIGIKSVLNETYVIHVIQTQHITLPLRLQQHKGMFLQRSWWVLASFLGCFFPPDSHKTIPTHSNDFCYKCTIKNHRFPLDQ